MTAKCGFCGASGTNLVGLEPLGSPRRIGGVACGRCGAVLGVIDLPDAGALLHHQAERIAGLRHHVGALERQLENLARDIERVETNLRRPHGPA